MKKIFSLFLIFYMVWLFLFVLVFVVLIVWNLFFDINGYFILVNY